MQDGKLITRSGATLKVIGSPATAMGWTANDTDHDVVVIVHFVK